MKRNRRGFTLVEIMIVVLIIGLLALIAIPSFLRARERARTNTCINNLRQIQYAIELHGMEIGLDDGDDVSGDAAVWATEIRSGMPTCPSGGTYGNLTVGGDPTCTVEDHILPPLP